MFTFFPFRPCLRLRECCVHPIKLLVNILYVIAEAIFVTLSVHLVVYPLDGRLQLLLLPLMHLMIALGR